MLIRLSELLSSMTLMRLLQPHCSVVKSDHTSHSPAVEKAHSRVADHRQEVGNERDLKRRRLLLNAAGLATAGWPYPSAFLHFGSHVSTSCYIADSDMKPSWKPNAHWCRISKIGPMPTLLETAQIQTLRPI